MTDIPREFRKAARDALSVASGEVMPGTYLAIENQVARALKAADEAATKRERERCLGIARRHTEATVGDAAETATAGLRIGAASIYNAILKGDA